jgi:acetolactate synthase-1/2/3 large subunit
VLVGDGGDFVATASYVLRPRGPLTWLDPGVFGTLGVGAGFALGAKLCRPESDVWLLWGDGAAGYGLTELDTLVRHRVPVIAVVGNDACWMQIAREQVEMLEDDVGCPLRHSDYHTVAEGLGGRGFRIERDEEVAAVLGDALAAARGGAPVLVNALLGATDFRKGSISI